MSKFTRATITLFISDFIHELYSTIVSSKVSTVQSSLFYLIAFIIFAMRGALTSDRRYTSWSKTLFILSLTCIPIIINRPFFVTKIQGLFITNL